MEAPVVSESIDHSVIGDAVTVGDRSIRAVARLKGAKFALRPEHMATQGQSARGHGAAGGAFVRITPVEFSILEGDGERSSVAVENPEADIIRSMLGGAVAIAIFSLLVSWMVSALRR